MCMCVWVASIVFVIISPIFHLPFLWIQLLSFVMLFLCLFVLYTLILYICILYIPIIHTYTYYTYIHIIHTIHTYYVYIHTYNTYIYIHIMHTIRHFSSVQSLSRVRFFVTPWIAACQASPSITNSQSLLKLMTIESVMPSSRLTLCRPLLLLPPIPPSIRVFSNESTLRMRWPKYWSFILYIHTYNTIHLYTFNTVTSNMWSLHSLPRDQS